jgi:hypothetical protein
MIDLNDYYSGGYFLLRSDKPDWPQLQTDLLPPKGISLSRHICPRLEVYWGWTPGSPEAALEFGIPQAKLDNFLAWCKSGYENDLDYTSMFYSPEAARRFIRQFELDTYGLYIIGTGLPEELEEANWREAGNEDVMGIEKRIEQHLPLETGGSILGFEVASFSYSDYGCSWLCNYLHQDMFDLYGIRPNQYGLIDTHMEAKQVYDWIEEGEKQGVRRAEPEPYDFWLLISYPLKISSP